MRKELIVITMTALGCATACAHGDSAPGPIVVDNTGTAGQAEAKRTLIESVTVTGVDVSNRVLTFRDKSGKTFATSVPSEVRRLDDIAVGDTVTLEVQEGLILEYQPAASPSVDPTMVAAAGVAGKDQPPAGAVAAGVQATVVVSTIDMNSRMVTLQVPSGDFYKLKAGPKVQLEKLKVGDRLLATYIETVAVRVEKAAAK